LRNSKCGDGVNEGSIKRKYRKSINPATIISTDTNTKKESKILLSRVLFVNTNGNITAQHAPRTIRKTDKIKIRSVSISSSRDGL
jgi:hypothetical protein